MENKIWLEWELPEGVVTMTEEELEAHIAQLMKEQIDE